LKKFALNFGGGEGRGGEGGFCKEFKLKKDPNSLDFDEKII